MTSWRWIVSGMVMNGEAKGTCWGSPKLLKDATPWDGVSFCVQGRRYKRLAARSVRLNGY